MDIKTHKEMVQKLLKKKFGRKKYLVGAVTMRYPKQSERELYRIINAYLVVFVKVVHKYLPKIIQAAKEAKRKNKAIQLDSEYEDFDLFSYSDYIFQSIEGSFEKKANEFKLKRKVESIAGLTRKTNIREWKRMIKKTIGVDIMDDYYNGELYNIMLDEWVDINTGLISSLPGEYISSMKQICKKGFSDGLSINEIMKSIQNEFHTCRSKARFLARDQMAKLSGQFTKLQQQDAGVNEYVWSTSEDSRVRPEHARLNGKRIKWSEPPIVDDKTGRRAHPGGDYQCRCVALPVFDIDAIDIPISNTELEETLIAEEKEK